MGGIIMKIAIAGGTGFVGKALTELLINEGHHVFILSRNEKVSEHPNITFVPWLGNHPLPTQPLEGIDALVNLAGQTINTRWTKEMKQKIITSRLQATETIIKIIDTLKTKPKVLINASAIGYYGTSLHDVFDEKNTTPGHDFLAQTVVKWEQTAQQAEQLHVRTVLARFGVILGKEDGALPRMVLPYKLFVGGPLGSGKQWLSWVHIDDVTRMIYFAIQNEEIHGPMNVTSPNPKRMNEFGKELAAVLQRPHLLPAPAFALRLALGEMSILVLEGQHVKPTVALEHGYTFAFPNLKEALENILK